MNVFFLFFFFAQGCSRCWNCLWYLVCGESWAVPAWMLSHELCLSAEGSFKGTCPREDPQMSACPRDLWAGQPWCGHRAQRAALPHRVQHVEGGSSFWTCKRGKAFCQWAPVCPLHATKEKRSKATGPEVSPCSCSCYWKLKQSRKDAFVICKLLLKYSAWSGRKSGMLLLASCVQSIATWKFSNLGSFWFVKLKSILRIPLKK